MIHVKFQFPIVCNFESRLLTSNPEKSVVLSNTVDMKPSWLSNELLGELQLSVSVLFFGMSFVGQRFAMYQGLGPLTYNSYRFIVSTALLLSFRPYLQDFINSEIDNEDNERIEGEVERVTQPLWWSQTKELWYWGSICGLSNFAGSVLQQIALVNVSVGKVGFITGMYVVVVPVVEVMIPGRDHRLSSKSWIAAISSIIGMYFLSGCANSSSCLEGDVGRGEILVFISVIAWVISILAADRASKVVDCVSLTCIEFSITVILNILVAYIYEPQYFGKVSSFTVSTWASITVVGFTEAAAFLLSTLGQVYTPASRAALIMSLEAVSTALGGYLVLGEALSPLELFGCAIMFAATLLSSIEWSSSEPESQRLISRANSLPRQRTSSTGKVYITGRLHGYSHLDGSELVDIKTYTLS